MKWLGMSVMMIVVVGSSQVRGSPVHVVINISGISPQDLELELALYDNSNTIGDSWVLIDNVQLGGVLQANFESGTLEGFDNGLNPASVNVVAGSVNGTGLWVMQIDEDPVTVVTFTWRDFPGSTATTLEFDMQMHASETAGQFGLDEFVVSLLDPQTLQPLVAGLTPGFGDVLAVDAEGTRHTSLVQVAPLTQGTSDRAQYSHKADLFVWPYVVLKWDNNGTPGNPADDKLLQDVFISVTNDSTGGAGFKMYYVDAYNCHGVDARLQLTGSDPAYFSALTGLGGGVGGQNNGGVAPPFKALNMTGYQDGANANLRKLEGYIVGWAVDYQNYPIGTNQLAASATVVDYQTESAWEYKPWAFRSNFTGVKPDPTMLALNFAPGQYQKCPEQLLLDFWASGSGAFGSSVNAPIVPSLQEFELTLVNAWMDFRPVPDFNGDGTPGNSPIDAEPATTSVQVQVWNEMEQPVSGTQKCLTCWDSTLGANYGYMGAASPFALTTLGTDKGKARLWAEATSACSRAGNPNSNPPILAKPARNLPILGVAHRSISWGGTRATRTESGLIGMGTRDDGVIYFDTSDQGDPPTMPMGNLRALPPSATQDDEPPA